MSDSSGSRPLPREAGLTREDVLTVIATAFHEVGQVDPSAVRADASLFMDLNIDSMVVAEALLVVEERFALSVSDDFAANLTTVGDLADHVLANSVSR